MRPEPSTPRRTALSAVAGALLILLAVPAAGWEIRGDTAPEDLAALHDALAPALYAYPRHGAAPLGVVGFELFVDVAAEPGFGDDPVARRAIDGSLPADALAVGRVGARKGLPGGIDLGLSWARALGGDLELVSGELSYALLDGGVALPAVGVRLTGSRTLDGGAYELEQLGIEALISKKLTVVGLHAGAGLVRSTSRLERPADLAGARSLEEESTHGVVYAGLTLDLLIPSLTVEVEQGEEVQAAVRLAFGF